MPVSQASIKNLVAGANKKPGGKRRQIILSGWAANRAISVGEGNFTEGLEKAVRRDYVLGECIRLDCRIWHDPLRGGGESMPPKDRFPLARVYRAQGEGERFLVLGHSPEDCDQVAKAVCDAHWQMGIVFEMSIDKQLQGLTFGLWRVISPNLYQQDCWILENEFGKKRVLSALEIERLQRLELSPG